jgi:hypothetical protein
MSIMDRASRNRLTPQLSDRFSGSTLFDRVARAGCLPRKELYEAWEVARRVRRVGYCVHTQTIPGDITPQNRLLLAESGGKMPHTAFGTEVK